jgi:signal transduction histidine kinase
VVIDPAPRNSAADPPGTDEQSAAPAPDNPLTIAALGLLDSRATAADLVERFRVLGAEVADNRATETLERLVGLGLARVASPLGEQRVYVRTSLGRRFATGWFTSLPDVAARLEEFERLRSDLISSIAHQLRTPLTAVRTCVGLLTDPALEPDPEERHRLLETLARNAELMQRVVADVLDLTRYRAGQIPLQSRRFDARKLAREVSTALLPLAESHRQSIELDLPADPVWVFGDHRRLEQALLNLLSNAQKFSPDGRPLRIEVTSPDGLVRWTVADQGPGVPVHEQPLLFERFFVGGHEETQAQGGAGLGLPLALAIAQAHGGTVEVDSAVGCGSRFTLAVPAVGPGELGNQ